MRIDVARRTGVVEGGRVRGQRRGVGRCAPKRVDGVLESAGERGPKGRRRGRRRGREGAGGRERGTRGRRNPHPPLMLPPHWSDLNRDARYRPVIVIVWIAVVRVVVRVVRPG